ncbi:hypothetical protein [Leisingera sp. ANG-M7]|uniref:hypothetical protein n=1 Tax=Leisingera sp. ANG-M7 TaxID=1577902 RepID=UPI00057C47D2|nr:hypothetical protein [Leisingera sp. ANG-M7]KIC36557.1 hypothetical protein RA26_12570 [Leisingera sp. ANG-M7]
MTKIFHFDPVTGEYAGEEDARPDPMAGQLDGDGNELLSADAVLVPGFATLIEPMAARVGFARVFADAAWSEVEDHRGKTLWTAEGEAREISSLGPLPGGLLTEKPVLPTYPDLEAAIAAMLGWINDFAATLTAAMPEAEVRSLPVKATAARAYLAGDATPEQLAMLQAEVDLTSEALADLAAEIVANADRDDQVNARISGLRRSLKSQLESAADAFAYETILEAGKQQALTMASDLGIAPPS